MSARTKKLNLALQGGGAHGAYTWGVLDRLLEDQRIDIDGISGTSAGAMNTVVLAHGMLQGGRAEARKALAHFWSRVSALGRLFAPVHGVPVAADHMDWTQWLAFSTFDAITRTLSPYQFNPFNLNPLRTVLAQCVDFEALRKDDGIKVFVCATNVRTSKPRIFDRHDISLDAVMASACLPYLFQAVEIGGQFYWDGGYIGNPAIFPLTQHTATPDVMIVHINPLVRKDVPRTAAQIMDRINEVTFGSSLILEMRSIEIEQRMLAEGWIKDEFRDKLKPVRMHALDSDGDLASLDVASKFDVDYDFLVMLRDRGRARADDWLRRHFSHLGERQTVDLRARYWHDPLQGE